MHATATLAAIALVVAYSFYSQSLGVSLTAVGLGTIVYAMSKSMVASLAVLSLVVFAGRKPPLFKDFHTIQKKIWTSV